MPELKDGETAEVKGSAKDPYILKNTGGVYSCTCPAWRNQSLAIESRTCKHLRQYLGEEFEKTRLGSDIPQASRTTGVKKNLSVKSQPGVPGTCESEAQDQLNSIGFLLAHSWTGEQDLEGWWMSEKLDGVRAYWDGEKFISRQGNVYQAPDWFIEDLPKDLHLDGELWLDRKAFQRAVSIVRRQDKNNDWKEIRYVVFDAPKIDDVFEARMTLVQQLFDELASSYAQAHLHVRCKGLEHLREELAKVEALGGEGLMLRKPRSKYELGRSFTLLKVKSFHDAEATVIEHLPGTGKHKGRLGALSVELADGTRFSVGTGFSDAERENPPAVGTLITFRYQEFSDRGVPRFPSFVRIRSDIAVSTSTSSSETAGAEDAVSNPNSNQSSNPNSNRSLSNPPSSSPPSNSGARSNKETTWRRFEFVDGSSSKFWIICVSGNDVTVKFGRIGSNGQEKTKSFASESAARSYAESIIAEKTSKGYEEK